MQRRGRGAAAVRVAQEEVSQGGAVIAAKVQPLVVGRHLMFRVERPAHQRRKRAQLRGDSYGNGGTSWNHGTQMW